MPKELISFSFSFIFSFSSLTCLQHYITHLHNVHLAASLEPPKTKLGRTEARKSLTPTLMWKMQGSIRAASVSVVGGKNQHTSLDLLPPSEEVKAP